MFDNAPIFVHSSFRTCSTYICNKFRNNTALISFYEPFNEQLETLNLLNINLIGPESWDSRHPVSKPYFLEYSPLLNSDVNASGVPNFSSRFAFDSFVPDGGLSSSLSSEEITYVSSLLDLARRSGKRPFIGCTRSLGRARSLKREFCGFHNLLHRALLDQWLSYLYYKDRNNSYFVSTIWRIIWFNKDKLSYFHNLSANYLDSFYSSQADFLQANEELQFTLFLGSHLYIMATAHAACNMTIDDSRLYSDFSYRKNTETQIQINCGTSINFDDINRQIQIKPIDYAEKIITDVENDVVDFLFKEGYSSVVPFVLDQTRELRADLSMLKAFTHFWRSNNTGLDSVGHSFGSSPQEA
jgi:hypothetical protein